jgi:hypothetical protein
MTISWGLTTLHPGLLVGTFLIGEFEFPHGLQLTFLEVAFRETWREREREGGREGGREDENKARTLTI